METPTLTLAPTEIPRARTTSDVVQRWSPTAIVVGLVVIGALVSLLRVPWGDHDVVWAEDGNIFLDELLRSGPIQTVFTGYAGYQHLVPRLGTMLVVGLFPLDQFAIAVFTLCSILTGLVAAAVFWLSRDLVPWIWARIALALITILLPLSSQEVLGNLADIHSYCMWLAPWLILYRPRTRLSGWLWAIPMLLCAMTEVQTLLFVALVPFRLRKHDRTGLPVVGALLLGGAIQIVTTLTHPRPSTAAWHGFASIIEGWLINTVLPLVFPDPVWEKSFLSAHGVLLPALIVIPFAVASIVALILGTNPQRLLVVTLLLASAAIYSAGATADGSPLFHYSMYTQAWWSGPGLVNSRYGVSSGMMLVATLPVAASIVAVRAWRRPAVRVAAQVVAGLAVAGLTVTMAIAMTHGYSDRHVAGYASWSESVRNAAEGCRNLPLSATAPLPVAPDRVLTLTCEEILSHTR